MGRVVAISMSVEVAVVDVVAAAVVAAAAAVEVVGSLAAKLLGTGLMWASVVSPPLCVVLVLVHPESRTSVPKNTALDGPNVGAK